MRVRGVFVLTNPAEPSPLDPCYNYVYGETEDYTVDITTSTGTPQVSGGNYTLFPNPATDAAMLRMPNAEPATLHLLDLQGRTVRTWRTNGTNQLLELGEVALEDGADECSAHLGTAQDLAVLGASKIVTSSMTAMLPPSGMTSGPTSPAPSRSRTGRCATAASCSSRSTRGSVTW